MRCALRFIIYFAGLFLLAIGINLAIISDLGVSPVSAPPLAISKILGVSLGVVTVGVYVIFVFAQACILRREFKMKSLLQIFFSLPFGYFVDLTAVLLESVEATSYFGQLLLMGLGMVTVSVGVIMFLEMDIVPNAPDGLVLAISQKAKTDFGRIKIWFDCISVITAIIISLLFIGNISIIREGTIISALLTGKIMGLISKPWAPRLRSLVFDISNPSLEDLAA